MKWKSHTGIARAIALEMGLSDEPEKALCAGSVEPDKRPDRAFKVSKKGRTYIGRAPHHQPPTGTIMAYAWRSRKAYLLGNEYWAVKSLGRALHYVQDKCVSTGFRGRAHDAMEDELADITPPVSAVRQGIDLAVCSPFFVRECVNTVRPRKDPHRAMYEATLFSSAIFASVLGPLEAEEEFTIEYGKAINGHRLRYALGAGAVATSAVGAYASQQPLLLVLGGVAALAAVRIDRDYYHLRDEAEWYGVD
jgi:hypothetical protein